MSRSCTPIRVRPLQTKIKLLYLSFLVLNACSSRLIIPTPPKLVFTEPGTFNYGTVVPGDSLAHAFTVVNHGALSATELSVSFSEPNSAYTLLSNSCPAVLAANERCDVSIQFSPLATGYAESKLEVDYRAGNDGAASTSLTLTNSEHASGLDQTFGDGGKKTFPVGTANSIANAVAVQSDGKIIAAGNATVSAVVNFAVLRFKTDGTLDTSFNGTGIATTTFASATGNSAYAVALQADGKIVAAGYANHSVTGLGFALARYLPNGALDTTFNTTGMVYTRLSASSVATGVAIQPDGKIVVVGYATTGGNEDFAVARYNSNGSLDTTFNGSGSRITPIGAGNDQAWGCVLQPTGEIVTAGWSRSGTNRLVTVVRYTSAGALDTSFNTTGIVTTVIGGTTDTAQAVALQADGKIVTVGDGYIGATPAIAVVRYTSAGALDTTFNSTGYIQRVPSGFTYTHGMGVVIQRDGKIVEIARSGSASITYAFTVDRFNTDGSLDTNFGSSGSVEASFTNFDDRPSGVALCPDGRFVVGGYSSVDGTIRNLAIARYWP